MEPQPTLTVPDNLNQVSLGRACESEYWANRFSVSREKLEEAVEQVGHSVNAVADYLERHR